MKARRGLNRIRRLVVIIAVMAMGFFGFEGLSVQSMALEQGVRCGIEAHTHTAECYRGGRVDCGKEEHIHSENCYLVLLRDNDINTLLDQMDQNPDNSLEGLIGQTVGNALVYNTDLTSPLAGGSTMADVAALNQTIEENNVQPEVFFNENLYVATASADTLGAALPTAETQPSSSTFALGDEIDNSNQMANYYVMLDNEWQLVGNLQFEVQKSGNRYTPRDTVSDILNLYNRVLGTSLTSNGVNFEYATSLTAWDWPDATKSGSYVNFGERYRERADAAFAKYVHLLDQNKNVMEFYTVTLNYPDGSSTQTIVRSGQKITLPRDYNWTENSDSYDGGDQVEVKSTRVFNAVYTVTLKYPNNRTVTTNVAPGGTFTLPEGIHWLENGVYHGGNTTLVINANRSFTGYYLVTLTYLDGTAEKQYFTSGASFTLPAGRTWFEDEIEYEGGTVITVNSARTFTEGTPDTRIKVSYNVNFPTITDVTVSTAPVLLNTGLTAVTDRVEDGADTRVRNVSNQMIKGSVRNSGNGLSRVIRFAGWKLNESDTVIGANSTITWDELVAYANGTGRITLTGIWEYSPLQTASFFIRYDSVAADTSGNTGSYDITLYTDEVFATFVGGVDTSKGSSALQKDYGIADSTSDNSFGADQAIRALLGQKAEGIWLYGLPDDADVFEQLKRDTTGKLKVDGQTVNVQDLNSNVYTIRWYVFKSQGDAWHVDGRLVKKEGLFDITKTFAGNKDAIEAGKQGFYITAQNLEKAADRYYLYLENPAQAPAGGKVLLPKSSANGVYIWTISGTTYGEQWRFTENPPAVNNAIVHGSYRVVDIYGSQSKAGNGMTLDLMASTVATDMDDWQALTVNFTNIYHNKNSIIIKKEDALTGAPLGGATFQLWQNNQVMKFTHDAAKNIYSYDPNGTITELAGSQTGYYELNVQDFSYSDGNVVVTELKAPTGYTLIQDIIIGYPAQQPAAYTLARGAPQTPEDTPDTGPPGDDPMNEDLSGGENTGGENTGGENTGGENTGGENTGGENTGGENTGGENTGGENTGGENTGGENTGGENTGGENTGGENTGGENTGGENPNGKNSGENTGDEPDGEEGQKKGIETEEPAVWVMSRQVAPAAEEGNAAAEILNPTEMASYNNGLLIVKNSTESTSVTVNTMWRCGEDDQRDVTVQLMANGAPVTALISGVELTKQLTKATGYTATWEDLPLYANGQQITWSVKEIKIGNENCLPNYSFVNWVVDYGPAVYNYDSQGRLTETSFTITNDTFRTMLHLVKTNLGGGLRLEGAKFKLEHMINGEVDPDFVVREMTTEADGTIVFNNLKFGDYRLTELQPPPGYLAITDPIYLMIQVDGTVVVQQHDYAQAGATAFTIQVLNEQTRPLPETGGPGTRKIMAGGLLLMTAAAAGTLFSKKKKGGHPPNQ